MGALPFAIAIVVAIVIAIVVASVIVITRNHFSSMQHCSPFGSIIQKTTVVVKAIVVARKAP